MCTPLREETADFGWAGSVLPSGAARPLQPCVLCDLRDLEAHLPTSRAFDLELASLGTLR